MKDGKKNILVTGGAGYIGSHTIIALEQAGYSTVIIDNFINSSKDVFYDIEKIIGYIPDFYECDITNSNDLEWIFKKYTFDGVIHFAGLKAVGGSCNDIGYYHNSNIYGSIVLFEIMQKYGVKKIIFSSSATVYSGGNTVPFKEDMGIAATNPYATSKITIEFILKDYARHTNWSVVILRYFNPIGAHPSGFLGELSKGPPNNLLPFILDTAIGKRSYVSVYGNNYPTRDGTCIRDYIDVCDLAEAHIKIYESNYNGFHIFNVGTGSGKTVLEIINITKGTLGIDIPYKFGPPRFGDIGETYADNSKILEATNWIPKTSIESSIQNAFNFIKNKKASFKEKPFVLHFTMYYYPHIGGIENYISEWMDSYTTVGGRGAIITLSRGIKSPGTKENHSKYDIIELPSVEFINGFPIPRIWSRKFWKQISNIKKMRPDIIHTHTRFLISSLIGGFISKVTKSIWIHIEHNADEIVARNFLLTSLGKFYDRIIGKYILKKSKHIIAINSACEQFLKKRFGIQNISVIYKGVYTFSGDRKLSKDIIRIGYVGGLRKIKRINILLEAYSQFCKNNLLDSEKTELVIIGDGSELDSLKLLSQSLGIEKKVLFLGQIPWEKLVQEYYPSIHIFVNPSIQTGFPTTLMEAISCGSFTIATQTIGIRELLQYIPIHRIAPENIKALESSLEQVIKNPQQLYLSKPNSVFEWKSTISSFIQLYSKYI